MKVFWFDCETSGVNPRKAGIMQLAYMLEIDGEIEDEDVLYANCNGKEVSEKALEITGFRKKEVAEWPNPQDMYHTLWRLFDSTVDKYEKSDKLIAAGYNVSFDMDFLRQLWFDNGDKYFGSFFAFSTIDVAPMFRALQWFGIEEERIVKMTLGDLAEYYGVELEAHDAAEDIRATRTIALRMRSALKASVRG
jgi:DNA polymerase-3 subunit epsilon